MESGVWSGGALLSALGLPRGGTASGTVQAQILDSRVANCRRGASVIERKYYLVRYLGEVQRAQAIEASGGCPAEL